jgi:hypothetical protein
MIQSSCVRGKLVLALCLAGLFALCALHPAVARAAEGEGDFRFAFTAFGNSFLAAKVHKSTGEAWSLAGGGWNKVIDSAAPPAGDYHLRYIVSENKTYELFRYETKSGRMWWFSEKDVKWTEYQNKQ